MTTALDHGILNVPLSKRGNIDAQIDKYKAEKLAAAKLARANASFLAKELKATAKPLLAEIIASPTLLDQKAANMNTTKKELLAILNDWAKWQPAKLIKLHAQWGVSK